MSLIEISAALCLALLLGIGGVSFMTSETQLIRKQVEMQAYATTLPAIRSVLAKTAAQATRTRIFSDAATARGSSNAAVVNGPVVRLEYAAGPNTPPGSTWQATLEYRAASGQLFYRNQDGKEWVAASNLTACTFSITDGALLTQFTTRGRTAEIYIAVN